MEYHENENETLDFSEVSFIPTQYQKHVPDSEILETIYTKLYKILKTTFSKITEKQEIITTNISENSCRINFACPYCGDSYKNPNAKRGNIYVPGYAFHCYNCQTHRSLIQFFSDFNEQLNSIHKLHIHSSTHTQKTNFNKTINSSHSYLINFEMLERYAIDKKTLFKSLNLLEINDKNSWWIKKYLKARCQLDFKRFAWDKNRNRLIIFNLLPSGNILGFQVRNFKSNTKYITYTLKMIYEQILKKEYNNNQDFAEANRFSFLFGLDTVDLDKMITIFEGPLDSFLFPNAMSICGIENKFILDVPHRYMLDNDSTGIKKSLEILNKGGTVFLWTLFLNWLNMRQRPKKLDFNDIVIYLKKHKKKQPDYNSFFSNSKYDLLNV